MSGKAGAVSLPATTKPKAARAPEREVALHSQLAALIEATPDGIALLDPHGGFRYANPACRTLLGIAHDEPLAALTLFDFCPPELRPRMTQDALPLTTQTGRWSADVELITRGGHKLPVSLIFFAHKELNAQVSFFSLIMRDISAQKQREAELACLAHHDALTGLFNRRRFHEELDNRLAQARRYGAQGALLFIDVDGLKTVNDTLGHQAGDALLSSLAALLRERLREVDVIARLGGDEFAVLIAAPDVRHATAVAERLVQAVRLHTAQAANHPLHCTISIGIAMFPQHGATAEELLAHADLALYCAKSHGRNQYQVYSPEMKP
ncbi:MAG TPA: GGDEF domain-containing protein [Methylomirabilota bacterium]|jgi:diguanylate cyclase (GGDEF)-like protein/PAS domain S-box-containing protein|nr:GGDEF domain-containing protein [Methylomirabilota bacterium]